MYEEMHPSLKSRLPSYRRAYVKWAKERIMAGKLVPFLVFDGRRRPVAGGSIWIRETIPSPRRPGTEEPYLMSVYTEPRYRNRGLATMVVKEAIRWSKRQGYRRMALHSSDEAEGVYSRLGFERTTEMRLALDQAPEPASSTSHVKPGRHS
jgi:GNAT superfamily N-acetyltransferase